MMNNLKDVDKEKVLKAAINASNTITAFYNWVDQIEEVGGATTISGIAKCHAFLNSMKKNKGHIDSLVMEPLSIELSKVKNDE